MTTPLELFSAALAGRYRIERELGQGGMATVYLAQDVKHQRKVALKVLHAALAATLGSERFLAEIRVTANLQHPHILPLLDSGEAGGFYYYVLPFVTGETLRERLVKTGALPVHDAVKILAEVVDALAAAHALGVVHRDIKPENVMLSGRHALVMDFGVAKAVTDATGRNKLTTAGVALGTPAYMAPEQAAADSHLDHRVDIYAVGAMGYELLSGRPPFSGMTNQEILAAQVTQAPEPLSTRRPACPPALAAVMMKCLEKRPADRPQSAEELLAELEKLATPSGGMTPTTTRPLEAARIPRGRKAIWLAGAAGVVALLVVGAIKLRRPDRTPIAAVLRDRRQLTSTGNVTLPAISPDGKDLAYVVTDCGGGTCKYGIDRTIVGGPETQHLVVGASALYGIQWSPERSNLLFTGTVDGRVGTYLISALGGPPKYLTGNYAVFWAGGDSLLVIPTTVSDSVLWARVSGLDGVARDSIRIVGPTQDVGVVGAAPGSRWLIVLQRRASSIEFHAIDGSGRDAGHLTLRTTDNLWDATMTTDALWAQIGADERAPIVRMPFDPRTGLFSGSIDTVYSGQLTSFDVTEDGGKLVVAEGVSEYSAWALDLRDGLRGTFPAKARVLRSTKPIGVSISTDGARLMLLAPPEGPGSGTQLTVRPFGGGTGISITLSGGLTNENLGADPNLLAVQEKTPAGIQLTSIDMRSGVRGTPFTVPDSEINHFTHCPVTVGRGSRPPAGASRCSFMMRQHRGASRFPGGFSTHSTWLRPQTAQRLRSRGATWRTIRSGSM